VINLCPQNEKYQQKKTIFHEFGRMLRYTDVENADIKDRILFQVALEGL